LAIKAPGFGDRRKESLEDIAILTGGTVISEDTGRTFESIEVSDLGQTDKVWADKDNTRIIGGKGDKTKIEARVASIRKQSKLQIPILIKKSLKRDWQNLPEA